jgi:hypothetical protein
MAKTGLLQFSKTHPPYRPGKCWACSIPEAKEINEGKKAGLTVAVILRWLMEEKGYSPNEARSNRLHYHFSSNHHEEK